jgi:hypothetical protein
VTDFLQGDSLLQAATGIGNGNQRDAGDGIPLRVSPRQHRRQHRICLDFSRVYEWVCAAA